MPRAHVDRRTFLRAGLGAGLGAALGLWLPWGERGWLAHAAPGNGPRKRLVVLFLRGAVDGLSVVVPHGDPAYAAARPRLAIAPPGQPQGALPLDARFGLHPALAPLLPLWRRGELGFVHACGLPTPGRSHFDAQAAMELGLAQAGADGAGWMNRLLGRLPAHAPTTALNVGPTVPRILAGPQAVASVTLRGATKRDALDRAQLAEPFDLMYAGDDPLSRAYREAQASRVAVRKALTEDPEQRMADNGAPPAAGFPAEARRLATLLAHDPDARLAFAALGGWDTHVNQGGAQGALANKLKPLGEGLAAFAAGLGAAWAETLVVVVSEFGRTLAENGNAGTDHGHGNVLWVLGGRANGGRVAGEWPGLAPERLTQGRDLAVTTDYRAALAELLADHLGLDGGAIAQVFPGFTRPGRPLGLVRRA